MSKMGLMELYVENHSSTDKTDKTNIDLGVINLLRGGVVIYMHMCLRVRVSEYYHI